MGELESGLLGCRKVASGAVVVVPSPRGEPMLVACFVPRDEARDTLTERLPRETAAFLPTDTVPARFLPLPELPLTLSGKLDRGALEKTAGTRTRTR
ncbi:hypothetical protein [Streptomyces sp. NPDC088766]|uniref:AMP-binding enzyme n=1 Tax=Streptomyces sp. NPDC088766 TaxID=3365893 RepID=UPI0037F1541D